MEIIALQDYTDKYVSLYEGEVRNIGKNLANRLIAKGIIAEHDETESGSSSGGSGSSTDGGVNKLVVHFDSTTFESDATYADISAAHQAGWSIEGLIDSNEASVIIPFSYLSPTEAGFIYNTVNLVSNDTFVGVIYKIILKSNNTIMLNQFTYNVTEYIEPGSGGGEEY